MAVRLIYVLEWNGKSCFYCKIESKTLSKLSCFTIKLNNIKCNRSVKFFKTSTLNI